MKHRYAHKPLKKMTAEERRVYNCQKSIRYYRRQKELGVTPLKKPRTAAIPQPSILPTPKQLRRMRHPAHMT